MKLHGHMTIELKNQKTGEVETADRSNKVTGTLNEIFSSNPFGVFYQNDDLSNALNWNKVMLPICPNMVGGILLFSSPLTEDPATRYAAQHPVAYASNDVNATTDAARGSLNLTESKVLDNGYKFVWDFSPSQGNGTIAAAALTSARGGAAVFGSEADDKSPFLLLKQLGLSATAEIKNALLFLASVDFEHEFG